jgi:signal transduction histidine kinase
MKLPEIVAAHRLQNWLLVTALVATVVTGLLVFDLARNLRGATISEASRTLTSAARELAEARDAWRSHQGAAIPAAEAADRQLQAISYEVLRSYPEVEGGYLLAREVIGHSFPTYTEPGSRLYQPPFEREEVLAALEESRLTGQAAVRVAQDQSDLVLVAVEAGQGEGLSAWALRRIFDFSDSSEFYSRLLLVAVMALALVAIGAALKLSFNLQQGFHIVKDGLERLRGDPDYRIPEQDHELKPIVEAINTMAESRKRLESVVRREDRLRLMGRVVAGIAHELRNPLNSIRLTIRVLARRLQGQPEAAEPIELITREVDRLDSLLKSLLVFRDDELPRLRRQPLWPALERTLALVKPHAAEQGVTMQLEGASQREAWIDANFFQQALMNLLLNAVDAAGRNGRVRLRLAGDDSGVELRVEDSGPGLRPEQQELIFEAFYTTKPGGSGLGLAVTKTLIEKMGGSIEYVEGAAGACFRVILPGEAAHA